MTSYANIRTATDAYGYIGQAIGSLIATAPLPLATSPLDMIETLAGLNFHTNDARISLLVQVFDHLLGVQTCPELAAMGVSPLVP